MTANREWPRRGDLERLEHSVPDDQAMIDGADLASAGSASNHPVDPDAQLIGPGRHRGRDRASYVGQVRTASIEAMAVRSQRHPRRVGLFGLRGGLGYGYSSHRGGNARSVRTWLSW